MGHVADLMPVTWRPHQRPLQHPLKPGSVNNNIKHVRAAYRYALKHRRIDFDYTSEQLRQILAAVATQLEEVIVILLAYTGMRLSEVSGLHVTQADPPS